METSPPSTGSVAPLRVVELPLSDPVAATLEQHMIAFIAGLYPSRAPQSGLDPAEFAPPGGVFLVAYEGGRPVGCAGLRALDAASGIGEVKRVWVEPAGRGRGISRRLMSEIERRAGELGYSRLWLDTGPSQHEAHGLYQSSGYHTIPNYGPETGIAFKTSYEKHLGDA